uniref:Charged multivesicular body protein 2a n=1 Tax=Macrostomum lignano TaxID=282301 RepID=A0A1I8IJL8_9PLAT
VRTRNYVKKFILMRANIQAISLKIQTLRSTNQMAQAMKGVTKTMQRMNKTMNLPQLQQIMAQFEKESEIMDMKEEMMSDAIDDAIGGDEDEEETEAVVTKVLDELGIELTGELAGIGPGASTIGESAGAAKKPAAAAAAAGGADGGAAGGGDLDDLESRLNNLRRHSAVLELHLEQVALAHLAHIVHDVLIVQQGQPGLSSGLRLAQRYLGASPGVQHSLRGPAGSFCDELGPGALVHVAEGDLGQQHDGARLRPGCGAVVGRLGDHVGKIHALAEHVAGGRGFGRGDAQALTTGYAAHLRQDAGPVSPPGPVPQQFPVRQLLKRFKSLLLALAPHLEDVDHFDTEGHMSRSVSILNVLDQPFVVLRVGRQDLNFRVQLLVVRLQRVLAVAAVSGLDHGVGHLDLQQVVQHVQLGLDDLLRVQHGRPAHAEVVRNQRVEAGGRLQELGGAAAGAADVAEVRQHRVDLELQHGLLHAVDIEDKLQQLLHLRRQLAFQRLLRAQLQLGVVLLAIVQLNRKEPVRQLLELVGKEIIASLLLEQLQEVLDGVVPPAEALQLVAAHCGADAAPRPGTPSFSIAFSGLPRSRTMAALSATPLSGSTAEPSFTCTLIFFSVWALNLRSVLVGIGGTPAGGSVQPLLHIAAPGADGVRLDHQRHAAFAAGGNEGLGHDVNVGSLGLVEILAAGVQIFLAADQSGQLGVHRAGENGAQGLQRGLQIFLGRVQSVPDRGWADELLPAPLLLTNAELAVWAVAAVLGNSRTAGLYLRRAIALGTFDLASSGSNLLFFDFGSSLPSAAPAAAPPDFFAAAASCSISEVPAAPALHKAVNVVPAVHRPVGLRLSRVEVFARNANFSLS